MSDFDPHNASGSKDKDLEGIIRPQELEDFTGQREIVSNLEVYIKAAKMRGEALDHTLFHGPPDWERPRSPISSPTRWGST